MRKATRRLSIEQALKRRICDGTYGPSARIPSRRELQKEFDVSPVTLQLALDRLLAEGFLVARGSRGTFVAASTPNTSRFAVVFPSVEAEAASNRFWSTMLRVAKSWSDAAGRTWAPYFIAGESVAAEAHAQLCADAADGRLAGVFFVSAPWYLAGSPIFAAPLPRVVISDDPADIARFHASHIGIGPASGMPDATSCRLFAGEGRRRLAALVTSALDDRWERALPAVRGAGLEMRRSWWGGFPTDRRGAATCRPFVRLLFDRPPTDRPDALFIGDDNLVPHATEVLLEMGVAVPREVGVIAHANLPAPTPSAVPCRRFGTDVQRLLATALAELDRLRRGAEPRGVEVEQVFPIA